MQDESEKEIVIVFDRKLRQITNTVGFSVPQRLQEQLDDKPRGHDWNITLRRKA